MQRFPLEFSRYVEVFGGGGWVLFHKTPSPFEVYNDRNSLLVNLWRCVRNDKDALLEQLRYTLNSREDFSRIRAELARDSPASDVRKAAWFYQLIRHSYGAELTSFAGQPHSIRADFPLIEQAHQRLERVVIENQSFETLIRHYDRPGCLFYCDPPYHTTERYYRNIGEDGFTEKHHLLLRDILLSIEGMFLLSYNDDGFVRGLYDHPGIRIEQVTRLNGMRQRFESGSQFPELLIANYDMAQRRQAQGQMTLF